MNKRITKALLVFTALFVSIDVFVKVTNDRDNYQATQGAVNFEKVEEMHIKTLAPKDQEIFEELMGRGKFSKPKWDDGRGIHVHRLSAFKNFINSYGGKSLTRKEIAALLGKPDERYLASDIYVLNTSFCGNSYSGVVLHYDNDVMTKYAYLGSDGTDFIPMPGARMDTFQKVSADNVFQVKDEHLALIESPVVIPIEVVETNIHAVLAHGELSYTKTDKPNISVSKKNSRVTLKGASLDELREICRIAGDSMARENYTEALSMLDQGIRIAPDADSLEASATARLQLHSPSKALIDVQRALEFEPYRQNLYVLKAQALSALGKFQSALNIANALIAVEPNAEYYMLRSGIKEAMTNKSGAISDCQAAIIASEQVGQDAMDEVDRLEFLTGQEVRRPEPEVVLQLSSAK